MNHSDFRSRKGRSPRLPRMCGNFGSR